MLESIPDAEVLAVLSDASKGARTVARNRPEIIEDAANDTVLAYIIWRDRITNRAAWARTVGRRMARRYLR